MSHDLVLLGAGAVSLALLHTLAGPDHYLPFIALARARGWSGGRTLGVTLVCGLGHLAATLVLALLALALGLAAASLAWIESLRGELASWLLLGFGIAYAVWGLRRAVRRRPHSHWHAHADGTVHRHRHGHLGTHAHLHPAPPGARAGRRLAPWVLFVVFVLGPCEPLIPLLLVPAAGGSWAAAAWTFTIFGATTLTAMAVLVLLGRLGLSHLRSASLERYGHALAGLALAACGLAIRLGL